MFAQVRTAGRAGAARSADQRDRARSLVLAGFAIAYVRYGTTRRAARCGRAAARARRCACPRCSRNAFYFDAAIEALFVRTVASARHALQPRRRSARHRRRRSRSRAISARALGTLVRGLQTGLVRAYALIAGVRRRVLRRLLRVVGVGRMMLALVAIGSDRRRARRSSRCRATTERFRAAIGALVAARDVRRSPSPGATPMESLRWLSRPFDAAFHFGATPISFWLVLLLALCTVCALLATRVPRKRDFIAQMLLLEGAMTGVFLAARPAAVRAVLGSDADPGLPRVCSAGAQHAATAWRYFDLQRRRRACAAARDRRVRHRLRLDRRDRPHAARIRRSASWAPWIFAGFRVRVLGEDAGLAAAHLDAATRTPNCRRRSSRSVERGPVEGRTLRVHRHRACVLARPDARSSRR